MRFAWILEQTAIISLYSINGLVFITDTECLLRGRTGSLNIIHVFINLSIACLWIKKLKSNTLSSRFKFIEIYPFALN